MKRSYLLIFLFIFCTIGKNSIAQKFQWAKKIGGIGYEVAKAIAVDAVGNIYITGSFDSTLDFDPGAGGYNLTPTGVEDMFVAKYNQSGSLLWAKRMGDADNEIYNESRVYSGSIIVDRL